MISSCVKSTTGDSRIAGTNVMTKDPEVATAQNRSGPVGRTACSVVKLRVLNCFELLLLQGSSWWHSSRLCVNRLLWSLHRKKSQYFLLRSVFRFLVDADLTPPVATDCSGPACLSCRGAAGRCCCCRPANCLVVLRLRSRCGFLVQRLPLVQSA